MALPTSCVKRWGGWRYCGARGQLTVRADSGFYTHAVVAVCRRMDVRFSIAIRQRTRLRNLIEAIPEAGLDADSLLDGRRRRCGRDHLHPVPGRGGRRASTAHRPAGEAPAPGSQLALFATYSYHAFITDRDGDTLELETDHRRHAEIENAIRDLKYGGGAEPHAVEALRRQRRLAGGPGYGA